MVDGRVEEGAGRQQRVGVGADREEGGIAEVEEPGEADHHVEPQRQQDVDARIRGQQHDRPSLAAGREVGHHREDQRPHQQGHVDQRVAVAEVDVEAADAQAAAAGSRSGAGGRAHVRSGTRMPSRPAGRKRRTIVRITKIITCVHWDEK